MKVEYRIKPVTRYIITRFESEGSATTNNVRQIGKEYDTADVAYEVGYALARADHERLGYQIGDERIRYPEHPGLANVVGATAHVSSYGDAIAIGDQE